MICLAACTHKTIKDTPPLKEIASKEQYWNLVIEKNKDYSNKVSGDTLKKNAAALEQNYPNPFCPSTNISFNVIQPGSIDLIIFDAMGQQVGQVHQDNGQPGHYIAKTEDLHVNSGIYYYIIRHNGIEVDRKKMIIIK